MKTRSTLMVSFLFAVITGFACGGVVDDTPFALPEITALDPGTPYNKLPQHDAGMAGLDSGTDARPDAGGLSDGGSADAAADTDAGGLDAGSGDAGTLECQVDLFGSARPGGDLKAGLAVDGEIRADCDAVRYSLVLAKLQTVTITLWGQSLYSGLHVYGPGHRGYVMESIKRVRGAVAEVALTADRAGEYFIVVNHAGRHGVSPFTVKVECTDKCELKASRYPIILVHGFSGFSNIGPLDYFYQVYDKFGSEGYDIYVAVLDPFNYSEKRGAQLAKVIDDVMAKTWANKVNIIAHSQGGIDSRYAISGLGYADRVGMLNTISSPHYGTGIADCALEDPAVMTLFKVMFAAVGIVIEGPQMEHDLKASLETMSTENMKQFNLKYPNDPRVRYRSWAGKSCKSSDSGCPNTINFFLIPTYNEIFKRKGPNDGIVQSDSGVWGEFQGFLNADHFQEVGHLFGMTGSFDHLKFYRDVIESTAALGY
ncbi:MAG: alpha/beta fold hydrolase [Myxococcota bacterium]|jgi:triacylglycerol esterase/lipase EstA (alpha/beta hydrolase family)